MVNMETKIPAAPTPATARPRIRNWTDFAMPQNREPSSKMMTDTRYTLCVVNKV